MTDACQCFFRNLGGQVLRRIVEHGRADTVFPARSVEYVNIDTAFTAFPERLVFCQVGESDWLIA